MGAATLKPIPPLAPACPTHMARRMPSSPSNRHFGPRLVRTAVHTLQIVLGYFVMLVVMTYNVPLCLSALAGFAIGFFVFSSSRIPLDVEEVSSTACH